MGNALRHAIAHVDESPPEIVVLLDADGAHDPDDIPNLLFRHLNTRNLLTIGNRWHDDITNAGEIPSSKRTANALASYIFNRSARLNLPDVACGLRVVDWEVLKSAGNGDEFDFMFQMLLAAKKRGGIGWCNVNVRYDARDVWITKQRELLQFLLVCQRATDDKQLRAKLKTLSGMASKWGFLDIAIGGALGNATVQIIGHPIIDHAGYLFQRQHPVFCELGKRSLGF